MINTIGHYAETATMIARAGLPGGHYLDHAADLSAVPRLLDLHQEAVREGSTLVTGAGFGVLATEAVVARLCQDSLASAAVPASPLVRALLPLAGRLLTIGRLRRAAVRRLAKTEIKSALPPRRHSWGHAVITWPDGTRREGWLRADDGMTYTASVAAEVALRLARGEGPLGAHTPAAAFGPELAIAAGGTFLLGEESAQSARY